VGLIDEKTVGRKSHATVPLTKRLFSHVPLSLYRKRLGFCSRDKATHATALELYCFFILFFNFRDFLSAQDEKEREIASAHSRLLIIMRTAN
jgi:hypothetical protein